MNICLYSDLHWEFGQPHITIPEEAHVVVLAGDIDTGLLTHLQILLRENLDKIFIYVPGNHDFYKKDYIAQRFYIKTLADSHENLQILDESDCQIDDVSFYGSTLWSDFTALGPLSEAWCKRNIKGMIGDFWMISNGSGKITPEQMAELNRNARTGLETWLQATKGKKVVVTHFPPLTCCKRGQIEENELSAYFTNNLTYMFHKEYSPDYWLYGHNHWSDKIMIGKTQLLSNQHGYPGEGSGNARYDPAGCMFTL